MRYAHSVEAVRAAERELMARVPEGTLMRRAAGGLAAACAGMLGRVYGRRVVALAGSGDNGGDALYALALLARRGAGVTAVLLAPDRAHAGGLAAVRAAGGRVIDAGAGGSDGDAADGSQGGAAGASAGDAAGAAIARADLVLDGIVGIGGRGGLRPDAVRLAAAVRASGAAVVAVDLPSGVDAETGETAGEAVRADATVTFGTYKPGLLIDPAAQYAGAPRLVDIGIGPYLPAPVAEALQDADVAALLPAPTGESDKYRRGVVGVVAGSARYPGAAVLAVSGALRGGSGAVRYVGSAGDAVIARFPEALVSAGRPSQAGRVQAWVAGPGLGREEDARAVVAEVLAADVPVLVDADGLAVADREAIRARRAPTVLTPHAGEAAALLGVDRADVEARRLEHVRRLARELDAVVLLKGSTTLIAAPDGPVRINSTGTAWLSTAGSGDVLSGLIGSLLAAGLGGRDAASVGAYLHGLAGRAAPVPFGAHELADRIPLVRPEGTGGR
ncbi:NAD(P)H-hydrate dehydratase [Streptomyces sp. SL13]|uniref:Bifunctional NAD(P)H-hydrate repair enzyme n=1 Tax=Streptantibioticus silvisoli TaxID=2705255 RepID=A0AA90H3G4_9ACTN|nr:NAD(P)H-hydrate dehydratase [Streptantibioticus silvisoli]MDI5972714.1 NAD(P)H-hydrate dehydratase [Streptantibioticus silvisoli]